MPFAAGTVSAGPIRKIVPDTRFHIPCGASTPTGWVTLAADDGAKDKLPKLPCQTVPTPLPQTHILDAMMLLEQLRQSRDQINAACHRYGARRIRVFGSVARGEERPDSNIDFRVDLPRGYDMLYECMPLQRGLTEITRGRMDVVPEHELSRSMRGRCCARLSNCDNRRGYASKPNIPLHDTSLNVDAVNGQPHAVQLCVNPSCQRLSAPASQSVSLVPLR